MRWHSTVRQGHDDSATRGPVPTSPQKAACFPNKRQLHECSESFRRRTHVNPTDKYGVGTTRNNRRPRRPREGFSPQTHTPTAWPQTDTADTEVGTFSQRIRIGSSLDDEAETTPMTPSELTPVASPKAVSGGWVSEPRRRRAQPAATLRRTPFGHQRRVSRGRTTARALEEPRINFSRNQCKL